MRKLFLHSPGHYIAALVVAIAVGLYRYFTLPDEIGTQFALFEIFSVSGCVTFLVGMLMLVAYFGAFDLFGYAFSPKHRRKYRDYADYSQQSAENRSRGGYYFVPYCVVGIVVALISALFS